MNRVSKVLTVLAIFLSAYVAKADVTADQMLVKTLLQKDPVVAAAIQQAKKFGTGHKCTWTFEKLEQPEAFQKNTTYDVEVNITCGENKGEGSSQGLINVSGRLINKSPLQEIDLSIRFAG